MKCDICNREIQWPDKFYSTGPLLQRRWACEQCYHLWVLPYRQEQEKLLPKGIWYFPKPSDVNNWED